MDSLEAELRRRVLRFGNYVGLAEEAVGFSCLDSGNEATAEVSSMGTRPLVLSIPRMHEGFVDTPIVQADRLKTAFFLCSRPASELAGGGSMDMQSRSPAVIQFSDDPIWGPLRGQTARWSLSHACRSVLKAQPATPWKSLITIDGKPWFGCLPGPTATGFAWAGSELPDLDELVAKVDVPNDQRHNERLLNLLPLLAFYRHAFGSRTWHQPVYFANFIIDDPPIRDRHGFFSPQELLGALEGMPSATTVAFIPWNWNERSEAAVSFFRSHLDRLSLCIHGCDHTKGEFASTDGGQLVARCQVSLERVNHLRETTGLSCAPVMVFPNGRFSIAAVTALRRTGFLAAANSTRFPVDASTTDVRLGDLIQPAFTRFAAFPILARRYPRDPALSAVDLFLGRPLVGVEHHEYFRKGYGPCRDWFGAINAFKVPVTWASLDHIVRRLCRQREIAPGRYEVNFYAHTFVLENRSAGTRTYHLTTQLDPNDKLTEVQCDGKTISYTRQDSLLMIEQTLAPGATVTVKLIQNFAKPIALSQSIAYRSWVRLRHELCDFRDNHPWVIRLSKLLKPASGYDHS